MSVPMPLVLGALVACALAAMCLSWLTGPFFTSRSLPAARPGTAHPLLQRRTHGPEPLSGRVLLAWDIVLLAGCALAAATLLDNRIPADLQRQYGSDSTLPYALVVGWWLLLLTTHLSSFARTVGGRIAKILFTLTSVVTGLYLVLMALGDRLGWMESAPDHCVSPNRLDDGITTCFPQAIGRSDMLQLPLHLGTIALLLVGYLLTSRIWHGSGARSRQRGAAEVVEQEPSRGVWWLTASLLLLAIAEAVANGLPMRTLQ